MAIVILMHLVPIVHLRSRLGVDIINTSLGYSNFDNGDKSKNTEIWGIVLLGELFQNNHHKFPNSVNFAKKWFEFDPTYAVLKVMSWVRIIQFIPVEQRVSK